MIEQLRPSKCCECRHDKKVWWWGMQYMGWSHQTEDSYPKTYDGTDNRRAYVVCKGMKEGILMGVISSGSQLRKLWRFTELFWIWSRMIDNFGSCWKKGGKASSRTQVFSFGNNADNTFSLWTFSKINWTLIIGFFLVDERWPIVLSTPNYHQNLEGRRKLIVPTSGHRLFSCWANHFWTKRTKL